MKIQLNEKRSEECFEQGSIVLQIHCKTLLTDDENNYILSLNEKELKAYNIAKKYLGTSFDLKKSNGFLRWKKENELL